MEVLVSSPMLDTLGLQLVGLSTSTCRPYTTSYD
jgi:hypothetical protein